MSKSNYGIKIRLSVAKPRTLRLSLGFLLVELMMAVFIGLILISSLMRMQSVLLELQDSFYMRGAALGLAIECLEYSDLDKNQENSSICVNKGRDFKLNLAQNSFAQNSFAQNSFAQNSDPENSKLIAKVKVEWKSLVGKNCCLEI